MPVDLTRAAVVTPTEQRPVATSPQRAPQAALLVLLVMACGLLLVRGYGHRLTARPTDHYPAPIHRTADLNTADRGELLQLPAVGPTLADAILTHRTEYGPLRDVQDLNGVHGIGDRTLERLRPWVSVTPPDPPLPTEPTVERLERKPVAPSVPARTGKLRPGDPPIDVNTATEQELQRLPGIGPVTARKIAAARPFESPDDLDRVSGIGPKKLAALRPFVICR